MRKTLLYKLFGFGKIPAGYDSALRAEGIILADEGIKGTSTFRNFRSPQRRAKWKRQWYTASVVMTRARLVAFQHSAQIIDVPFADTRFRELNFACEPDGAMLVQFDASLFHNDWSGTIEYRFFTPRAKDFLNELTAKQHKN